MSPRINKINFSITKQDVVRGKRFECSHCPTALAIKRKLGLKSLVCGGSITIYLDYDTTVDKYTPRHIADFTMAFDYGKPVTVPIKFSLSFTEHEYEMVCKASNKIKESKEAKKQGKGIEQQGYNSIIESERAGSKEIQ